MKIRNLFFTILLITLPITSSFCIDMYLPAYLNIAKSFNVLPADINFSMSAYLIGLALGQLMFGPLSDSYGRRKPLLSGILLFLGASVMCVMSTRLDIFIMARFLQALGACSCIVIARAIVADIYPLKQRTTILGLISASNILSPMFAPLIGGSVVTFFNWQSIFIIVIALGSVMLLGVYCLLTETLKQNDRQPLQINQLAFNTKRLLSSKFFISNLICVSLFYAAVFVWVNNSSHIIIEYFKIKQDDFGFFFALPALGYTFGSLITANYNKRVGEMRLLWLGFSMVLLSTIFLSMIHDTSYPLLMVLNIAVIFLSIGIVQPILISLAVTPFTDMAGLTMGIIGFTQANAGALIGILTSRFYHFYTAGMALLMLICICTAFFVFMINYQTRQLDYTVS